MWNPRSSNLVQVVLSIQGLILGTSTPYYLEAGYEKQRGTLEGAISSRRYNEGAYLLTLRSMVASLSCPLTPFESLIKNHFKEHRKRIMIIAKRILASETIPNAVDVYSTLTPIDLLHKAPSTGMQTSLRNVLSQLEACFTRSFGPLTEQECQEIEAEVEKTKGRFGSLQDSAGYVGGHPQAEVGAGKKQKRSRGGKKNDSGKNKDDAVEGEGKGKGKEEGKVKGKGKGKGKTVQEGNNAKASGNIKKTNNGQASDAHDDVVEGAPASNEGEGSATGSKGKRRRVRKKKNAEAEGDSATGQD